MVVYEDKIVETRTYRSLLKELSPENVMIYDNSKTAQNNSYGFHYIHNPSNPGVSKAYNFAAGWADKHGFTHLLLLDSDSSFPENAFQLYRSMAKKHIDQLILPQVIAGNRCISPFWFKWGKSWYGDDIPEGKIDFRNKAAINSGMLIPLKQFQRTEGYDEEIALDWSDIAFCRQLGRLNITGEKIAMRVDHDLSESRKSSLASAKFRFKTYMQGLKRIPNKHIIEDFLMLIWAKLKAVKLCLRYKTIWFLLHYFRELINA